MPTGRSSAGSSVSPPLRELDAPLDGAHGVQVLRHARPVSRADVTAQPREVVRDGVEDAPVLPELRSPLGRRAAFTEELLEHDARVVLHRQRRRRVSPRDGVHVDAAIAVLAVAHQEVAVDRQLQRRQRRRPPELGGGDLVGRHPGPHVGPFGLLRVDAVQPGGRRPRMLAVAVAERLGLPLGQPGEHHHPVTERAERAQRGRELQRGLRRRGPRLHRHAVREVDPPEPARRLGRPGRDPRQHRGHRIQHRERQRRADPAQEGAPRQRLLGDDHDSVLLSLNGALLTIPTMSDENR